jgi:hypothetical protein
MKKLGAIVITLGAIALLVGLSFFLIGYFQPKGAGILIKTTPAAAVYVNGEQVGSTPYEATRVSGEVVIKLVPDSNEKLLAPYETRVTLNPKIQTIINRDFGESEETSQGETISFERIGGKEASLAVVSIPDNAQVSIDGQLIGFAPYKTSAFAAGDHQIAVSAPNCIERTVTVRTLVGYKLTAVVKLASTGESQQEQAAPQEPITVSMVKILDTPTGFLRVRAAASVGSEEVGQVEPGEIYRYLETDEATGWYKIEYENGKEGWVSNQYAKLVEESVSPTPTQTPTPSATPTATM